MGPEEHGGHCELVFEGLEIPVSDRLMNEATAETHADPSRPRALTHCMRWLGLSKRCVEIARAYAEERYAFGERLSKRESIQMMLGDLAMEIEIGRCCDEGRMGA